MPGFQLWCEFSVSCPWTPTGFTKFLSLEQNNSDEVLLPSLKQGVCKSECAHENPSNVAQSANLLPPLGALREWQREVVGQDGLEAVASGR